MLVANEFIGVNFIDTYFRSGLYPRSSFPSGLGEEGAGTIQAVGPGECVPRSNPPPPPRLPTQACPTHIHSMAPLHSLAIRPGPPDTAPSLPAPLPPSPHPSLPASPVSHLGVEGVSVGDRVGYTTRSQQLGGSYADCTVVAAPLVTKLPESVSTQDAAAILLQGLTALSQATVAVANEIKQGVR